MFELIVYVWKLILNRRPRCWTTTRTFLCECMCALACIVSFIESKFTQGEPKTQMTIFKGLTSGYYITQNPQIAKKRTQDWQQTAKTQDLNSHLKTQSLTYSMPQQDGQLIKQCPVATGRCLALIKLSTNCQAWGVFVNSPLTLLLTMYS